MAERGKRLERSVNLITLIELKELIKDMPDDAVVLINYIPDADLIDLERVYLTGFDEYNPVVAIETKGGKL